MSTHPMGLISPSDVLIVLCPSQQALVITRPLLHPDPHQEQSYGLKDIRCLGVLTHLMVLPEKGGRETKKRKVQKASLQFTEERGIVLGKHWV